MKRVLKIFSIVLLIALTFTLTGCFKSKDEKAIAKAYEKSQVSKDNKGYVLDLRINGFIDKISINKIVRIDNYQDKEYKIVLYNNMNENTYVVKDKNTYVLKSDKYEKTASLTSYTKPDSYLDGLNDLKSVKFVKEETIAKNKYNVYNVVFKEKAVNKMLKDTDLTLKVSDDINGEVWTNSDGRIYKIYYKIDKLVIYASYFGYNATSSITVNQ